MHSDRPLKFNTRAVHAGQTPDPATGAIMTPIYQTSTFVQKSPGKFVEDYDYSRGANPTRTAFQNNIASLENAKHGLAFSSGVAATAAVIHLLSAGDHVILCDDVYGGTNRLYNRIFGQLGIEISMVDLTDDDAYNAAFRDNTKLVWIETPTNPTLKIVDIEKAASVAKRRAHLRPWTTPSRAPCCRTRSTWAPRSSAIRRPSTSAGTPTRSGACSASTTTSSTNGSSSSNSLRAPSRASRSASCSSAPQKRSASACKRHCENAAAIAAHLDKHPAVDRVVYPGLESHPQHAIAKKQMRDFGGMITIFLKGGLAAAKTMLERVELFALAESLGGVESLIEHPAIMTHASVPADQRQARHRRRARAPQRRHRRRR